MDDLQKYLAEHYTAQTAQSYYREIEIYRSNNPNHQKYTYSQILNYMGALRQKYQNPNTLHKILASIKTYYNYLCISNQRTDNPTKFIQLRDKISRDIQLQDLFTTEELEQLLAHKPERYAALAHRNKVLMSLLIYQGLLPRELSQIMISDFNLQEAIIVIKPTKTTNGRALPLKSTQILLFQHYQNEVRKKLLKGEENNKFLVGIRSKAFTEEEVTSHLKRNYKDIFQGRKVNARTIRQSVITNLLKQNNDLRVVQTFAGHKYPSTTERYKQNNTEALQQQIDKYHPLK